MSISALLRLARESADLPCRGLAKLTGLTPASISMAEGGELKYSDRTRRRVLEVLLRELSRAQDLPQPRCVTERDVKRELGHLIAASEVLRAESAVCSAESVLASWG